MNTVYFKQETGKSAELLMGGGLVAVPTETVYGLAADGLNENAVRQVYEVKGRPAIKPLSLMVPDASVIDTLCENVPEQAYRLADRFWPGPLTIVLNAKPHIPGIVLAGGNTVGLRCPAHPLTLKLLREVGTPLAVPSANPSGKESPKDAETVRAYFDGQIDAIIDGGTCGIGKESTLISLAEAPYRILRKGALGEDEIADALISGMTVFGVTGLTGAGKTTALQVLQQHGALILDCDKLYHELLHTDNDLIAALQRKFPDAVHGTRVDRKTLAEIVFSEPAALMELNTISHAYVQKEVRRRLRGHAMNGGHIAAIDAVELFAGGLGKKCDYTWCINAPEQTRLQRVMERDGICEAAAAQRMRAQKPLQYYVERCSRVLDNDGSREQFIAKCENAYMEDTKNG